MKITLSLFASTFSKSHDRLALESWKKLVEALSEPVETEQKTNLPAYCPARFRTTQSRSKRDAVAVGVLALDIDHCTQEALEAFLAGLEGKAYFLYSTLSHTPEGEPRCRVLFPLSREVQAFEWADFWPRAVTYLGANDVADAQCCDVSRLYFPPAHYPGKRDSLILLEREGKPLNVEEALATAPRPIDRGTWLTRRELSKLANKHRQHPLREAMRALANGETYAEEGQRDNVTYQLLSWIYETWPKVHPDHVVKLFAQSIQLMVEPSLETVRYKAQRAYEQHNAGDGASDQQRALIAESFGNGRTAPYTEDELNGFAMSQGCSVEEFRKRWLLIQGKTVYIFHNGAYKGPFTREDFLVAAETLLAPAISLGVELKNKEGVPYPPGTVLLHYSSVVAHNYVSLTAQQHTYDKSTNCLTEAHCPLRKLPPTYNREVEQWLSLLGGKQRELLLDWLCGVLSLESPCVALVIVGPPGIGKSLLGHGLARIWTTNGPTTLEQAMGDYTDSITKCPLVFGDEMIPKDFRGNARTQDLRQFIQATQHPLKRRYRADSTIVGATRTLIVANNDSVISLHGDLNKDDLRAIAQRFLVIQPGPRAAEYLQGLECGGSSFVLDDILAKHVHWLIETRDFKPKGRFLIQPDTDALVQSLALRNDITSTICQILCKWLRDGAPNKKGLVLAEGELLARPEAIVREWSTVTRGQVPGLTLVSRKLAGLSRGRRRRQNEMLRVVDVTNLQRWATETDYLDSVQGRIDSLTIKS